MNFGAVLGVVSAFLDEKGCRYAVIGGVALIDIRLLLTVPGVDRRQIKDYFVRQGMKDRFDDLEKTL